MGVNALLTKKIKFNLCLLTLFVGGFSNAQTKDLDKAMRELFSSVVFISDSLPKIIESNNGSKYQLIYKDLNTGKLIDKPIMSSGSGFIISKDFDMYLVTAKHVSNNISIEGKIQFQDFEGESKEVKIKKLVKDGETLLKLNWITHPSADVAVLHLDALKKNSPNHVEIGLTSNYYSSLHDSLEAPKRSESITILGFPLKLGAKPQTSTPKDVSPISKSLRPASDILWLNTKGTINPYFLLDDPSISGFSGGPVMSVNENFVNWGDGKEVGVQSSIFGLVQGTINDSTGGFATIVPSKSIIETIDLAPAFNGKYTFYYPNGKIWSERIYVNGFPYTVLTNYGPDGQLQDMGTLKDGNGYYYMYNEKGEKEWGFSFKDGKPTGNFSIMPTEKFKKIQQSN